MSPGAASNLDITPTAAADSTAAVPILVSGQLPLGYIPAPVSRRWYGPAPAAWYVAWALPWVHWTSWTGIATRCGHGPAWWPGWRLWRLPVLSWPPACCGCLVLPCPCLAALLPPVACGCLPRLDSCPERPPGAPGLCPAAFGRFQPGYNPHRLPVILPPPLDRSQLLGIQEPMPAPWNGRGPGCSWRVKRESA